MQPLDDCRMPLRKADDITRAFVEKRTGIKQDIAFGITRDIFADACPCTYVSPPEVSALNIDLSATLQDASAPIYDG